MFGVNASWALGCRVVDTPSFLTSIFGEDGVLMAEIVPFEGEDGDLFITELLVHLISKVPVVGGWVSNGLRVFVVEME